jgi:hypothetical protein
MAEQWRAPGGWTVEVVRVTGTGNRDGEWLRLRQYGYWTADVRSVAELAEWLELASLEEDALALVAASRSPLYARRVVAAVIL